METTIGFIKEAPGLGVCGYNVYHKNRLIRVRYIIYQEKRNFFLICCNIYAFLCLKTSLQNHIVAFG